MVVKTQTEGRETDLITRPDTSRTGPAERVGEPLGPLEPGGSRRPGLTLAVVCAAIVLVPVTATGASVALPDVSSGLDSDLASTQWVMNAFFLTFASFMAISGSLADRTGRRRMFAGGIGLFAVAMLVATFAPTIGVLIAARVIAGIGAAGTTTGGSALLAQAFTGPLEPGPSVCSAPRSAWAWRSAP